MTTRTCFILTILAVPALGQFDDRLWLVQASGTGPGQVLELDRDGLLVGMHPGPAFGSSAVVKDVFLRRVWVTDDHGGSGPVRGRVRLYESGIGELTSLDFPGIRGLALQPNGNLAALVNPGPFTTSLVQVIPQALIGQPWPAPIPVGQDGVRILAGRLDTVWVLSRVTGSVFRVDGGGALEIPLCASGVCALQDMVLAPDGGVIVSRIGSPEVQIIDPSGTQFRTLVLPEPPLRMDADADVGLFVIGSSGTLYRVHLRTGDVLDSFVLPAGTWSGLIADQGGSVWVEETLGRTITRYGPRGTILSHAVLPVPTSTRGDPLGLVYGAKTNPDADVDGDSVSGVEEILRGTDVLSAQDLPPRMIPLGSTGGIIPLVLAAPGRAGQLAFMMASVSGNATTMPLGADGFSAPYYDLSFLSDPLSTWIAFEDLYGLSMVSGMPINTIDPGGLAVATINTTAWLTLLPPGVVFYAQAFVWAPAMDRIEASSARVAFDAQGIPQPLP